jgi:hypothetical protein
MYEEMRAETAVSHQGGCQFFCPCCGSKERQGDDSMRENVLRFRLSDLEMSKLKALVPTTGQTGVSETLRFIIEKTYDREVLGLKPPCNKPSDQR